MAKYEKYEWGNYMGHPITWRILDKSNDILLLITDQIIEAKAYNDELTDITWENSTIRAWLNGEFLSNAFTENEQEAILQTIVINDDNKKYKVVGGNATYDKIFLLSTDEVKKYFSSKEDRQAQGTEYAKDNELKVWENGNSWWWLRSPGIDANFAAHVYHSGHIIADGRSVGYNHDGVRPALWIDLSKL